MKHWQKILLDAADLLKRSKWWRPGPSAVEEDRPGGAHCVLTAFNAVSNSHVMATATARHKLRMTLLDKGVGADIPRWNDSLAKSKAEVIRTMREAAKQ